MIRKTKTDPSSLYPKRRILATKQEKCPDTNLWKPREIIASVAARKTGHGKVIPIHLRLGGTIHILPNAVKMEEVQKVTEELLHCGMFRQYRIQGNNEPRAHFLLHEDATTDFQAPQPGYRYATTTMKARPLSVLPQTEAVSQILASACGIQKWTIGVNPILYRDQRDKMGDHADDDQGEEKILCLVLKSPKDIRPVNVHPFKLLPQDEAIELFISPGDVYDIMDAAMQVKYSHSVPPQSSLELDQGQRMAVIFRTGIQKTFDSDSGRDCKDLSPRKIKKHFFGKLDCLREGWVYKREQLFDSEAHLRAQGGISGCKQIGCDAIIVSGQWKGKDGLFNLTYTASSKVGAMSMVKSFKCWKPIRVFRSSSYLSPFRAAAGIKGSNTTTYRYDGLYKIVGVEDEQDHHRPGFYKFFLIRVEKGDSDKQNDMSNTEFLFHCERNLRTILPH